MKMRPNSATVLIVIAILAPFASPARAQSYSAARAGAYQRANDWQGLVRYATAWTQAEPNSMEAWGYLGTAYSLGLNEPDKAIAPLKRCVVIDPNSAPAWHALGVTYIKAKQHGDAVAAIKRAIQINPNQPTYYNNLAAAYSEGGAFKSALATLDQEKPLAERLNNAKTWYVLGNGYAKLSDLNNAAWAFKQAVKVNPTFAEAWTNLAVVLQYSGNVQEAQAAYRRGQLLGDPLAAQDAAQLQADLRQQEQNQAQIKSTEAWLTQAPRWLGIMHKSD